MAAVVTAARGGVAAAKGFCGVAVDLHLVANAKGGGQVPAAPAWLQLLAPELTVPPPRLYNLQAAPNLC